MENVQISKEFLVKKQEGNMVTQKKGKEDQGKARVSKTSANPQGSLGKEMPPVGEQEEKRSNLNCRP